MKRSRLQRGWAVCGAMAGLCLAAGPQAAEVPAPLARLERLASDPAGLTVELRLPAFALRPERSGLAPAGLAGYELEVPGLRSSVEPGAPALPGRSLLVPLPPGAEPVLVIEDAPYREIEGVWLAPPRTTRIDGGLDEGPAHFEAVPDDVIYGTDAFVPAAVARISSRAVARDLDVALVEIFPFQWNPVERKLRVYDRVRFRIDYGADRGRGAERSKSGSAAGSGSRERRPLASGGRLAGAAPSEVGTGAWAGGSVPAAWRQRRMADNLDEALSRLNPAAAGEAWRLEVSSDGLYTIRHGTLAAAGFSAVPVSPMALRLSLRGQAVPLSLSDRDGDGQFGPGDSLEFHGVANPERWSATHQYWLTVEPGGIVAGERPALPDGAAGWPRVTTARARLRQEKNEQLLTFSNMHPDVWNPWVYQASLKTGETSPTETCYNPWTIIDLDFSLSDVAPPDPAKSYSLRGQLMGRVSGGCNPEQQQVNAYLRGQAVGSVTWGVVADGALHPFELPINPAILTEGAGNTVHLEQPLLPGKFRWSYLDWLEIEYERHLRARAGRADFEGSWASGASIYVGGFASGDLVVLDVRGDGRVERLRAPRLLSAGPGLPMSAVLAVPPDGGVSHHLLVYERGSIPEPRVTRDTPSTLVDRANAASFLVISHPDFLAPARDLADYRRSQGLSAMAIDVQDVYDEFSYGNTDAHAIEAFLGYALSLWAEPPLYVVLVGDSTQDFRNDAGVTPSPFFVPHLEWVPAQPGAPYSYLYRGDSQYQTLIGADPVPDLLLGRLAVQSAAELSGYLSRLQAYEAGPSRPWNGKYMLVVDDNHSAGEDLFSCSSAAEAAETFAVDLSRCYMDSDGSNPNLNLLLMRNYGPPNAMAGNQAIVDARNQGAALMLYAGHGAIQRLGIKCGSGTPPQYIFGVDDLPRLTNSEALPLSMTMSCDVGQFDWQQGTRSRCFGELFTLTTARGDMAYIGSTAGIAEVEGRGQHEGFLDALFRPGSALLPPFLDPGDARRRVGALHFGAQLGMWINPRLFDSTTRERGLRTLALHGDPAARMRIDDPPVAPRPTCP